MLLAIVALLVACGGESSTTLNALPPGTCDLLNDDLTVPPFGTVENSLSSFLARGSVDAIVYVEANADTSVVASLREKLENDPLVESVTYLDHEAAFAEFQSLFTDQPAIAGSLTAAETPTSFRVELTDVTRIEEFRSRVEKLAGVYHVIDPISGLTKGLRAQSGVTVATLAQLEQLGGTEALLILVHANQRLYAALEEDDGKRLFGTNGIFTDDELNTLRLAAVTLASDIADDCNGGFSS